jgi:tetraacyldisaccharide 4'-kinase
MVISVGNITMGGTGKTPFTIFLAKLFSGIGKKVAILSRGYKGKLGYDLRVISDGKSIFFEPPLAADEPYMMARNLPGVIVITGKDRTASLSYALENFSPPPEIFLLDDGFQHRKLNRDADILLLDQASPVSTGFVFPFGYLREFPSAINRADMVIFTRSTSRNIPEKVERYCQNKPVFFCDTYYTHFNMMGSAVPLNSLSGKEVWLVSAIANPKQFEKQLLALGLKIVGHSKFPDHYAYTAKDIEKLFVSVRRLGAELLITTEKDFVRIPDELKPAFIYPTLEMRFLNGTEKEFASALGSRLKYIR